jgi:hypothetical protein
MKTTETAGEMTVQYEPEESLRTDAEDSKESERVVMSNTLAKTNEKKNQY